MSLSTSVAASSSVPAELASLKRAVELIRAGQLVAFPTETVYGLGANALDANAVARIFELKGRPSTSPLIVHVASIEMARTLVTEWPPEAEQLARRYWPGPLTLVLPKVPRIPDLVTAGLPTVGIRMPNHPIALKLIEESGVPVAAPSANRFMGLSPTTAEHVREEFGEGLLVLDGGPCEVGIESTVVSLNGPSLDGGARDGRTVTLLRPGMIPLEEIMQTIEAASIGSGERREGTRAAATPSGSASTMNASQGSGESSREGSSSSLGIPSPGAETHWPRVGMPSPGMHPRHYSPRTPLLLVDHPSQLPDRLGMYLWRKKPGYTSGCIRMPLKPAAYAARLYSALHQADRENWPWIAVETPPGTPAWAAILDRLRRAAAEK